MGARPSRVTKARARQGKTFSLRLRRGRDAVWVEVFDNDMRLPRIRSAGETDEGGRGLYLVDQLATRWGSRPTRDGKAVWFEMPLRRDYPGRPLTPVAASRRAALGGDTASPRPASPAILSVPSWKAHRTRRPITMAMMVTPRSGRWRCPSPAAPRPGQEERQQGGDEHQQDDPTRHPGLRSSLRAAGTGGCRVGHW